MHKALGGRVAVVASPLRPTKAFRTGRGVTHTHTRETLSPLLEDADAWAHTISPTDILHQVGSPFADADPPDDQALTYAA